MADKVRKEEIEVITKQLRRSPRGVREVVRYCPQGKPLVIRNHPFLAEGRIFPTLYYLTCPFLITEVSKLEGEGWISRLQNLLWSDQSLKKKFLLSQKRYGEDFLEHLKKEEEQEIPLQKRRFLTKRGVGGVRNWYRIKCLHSHYAHFLATGENPIGERIEILFKEKSILCFTNSFKCIRKCG